MNEARKNAYDAEVSAMMASGASVMSFEDILKNPELMTLGENRGSRFTFVQGEHIEFPDAKTAVFFTTSFTGNDKKTYKVLKVVAVSSLRGIIKVPAASLCCNPFLEEEKASLYQDNDLGRKLAEQQPDYQRLMTVSGHTVEVFYKSKPDEYHSDFWKVEGDQRVHVEDSKDLPKRKSITCFKFRFVKE